MVGRQFNVACDSLRDLSNVAKNLATDAERLGSSSFRTPEHLHRGVQNATDGAERSAEVIKQARFAPASVQTMQDLHAALRDLPRGADGARRGAALLRRAVDDVSEIERARTPADVAAAYTPDERVEAVHALVRGSRWLEPLHWVRLTQLLDSAPRDGIGGIGRHPDLERFKDIARSRAADAPSPLVERDEARTLAIDLLALSRAGDVDAARRLKWVLDTDPNLRRVTLPRKHDSVEGMLDLSGVLDEVLMEGVGTRQRELLDNYAELWRWHDDGVYRASHAAAYDGAVARLSDGTASPAERTAVMDGIERYADGLADRPESQRRAIARAMLAAPETYHARADWWLSELRESLGATAASSTPEATVARSTRDLVDTNLSRVRHELLDGMDGEVDYAQIGAISSNLDMLERFAKLRVDVLRAEAQRMLELKPWNNPGGGERLIW